MAATAVLVGYLLGSFPTAYLVGRLFGMNVLHEGSGTVGAFNVARLAGGLGGGRRGDPPKVGAVGLLAAGLVLLVDAGKGSLAVRLAQGWTDDPAAPAVAGLAAVAGHLWMLFLRFRGGKGVATSAGVLLTLSPGLFLIVAAVAGVTLALVRHPAVAVAAAASALPFVLFLAQPTLEWFGFGVALSSLLLGRHAADLRRFLEARTAGVPRG